MTTETRPETQDPPELTLAEVLALPDEERAALPPERQTIHIDQVRETLTEQTAAAVEAERSRIAAEQTAREQQERDENTRVARIQEDITFAEALDGRLASDDEAIRKTAELEKQNNFDRYAAGVKAKSDQSASATMNRVLKEHYGALTQLMIQQNQYPDFISSISQRTQQAGNNPLVAAIEFGKSLAAASEYERGKDEGARAERIALGREGNPDLPGGAAVVTPPAVDPRTWTLAEAASKTPAEQNAAWAAFYADQAKKSA